VPALGLVTDIVGYGCRNTRDQQHAQERLYSVTRNVLADLGMRSHELLFEGPSGDGMSVVLPVATDPARVLPRLLAATSSRLRCDNERYTDQLRLRMAVGFGLVGRGPLGLVGHLIVELARLSESAPIRKAVVDNPRSHLFVLVSRLLHQLVDRTDAQCLVPAPERVDVAVKEYEAPAWLWIGG
jgi:hypothetical protein